MLRRVRSELQDRVRQSEDQVYLVLTLIIGVVVGLAVVAFILITDRLGDRLNPAGGLLWRRLAVPVAGSLIAGYLLYKYFPNARGSGVPQTKAALHARDGFISLRTVIGKFCCTAVTLASGIPLGREGPAVQVGAGISSLLGRSLGLSPERLKSLLPVGVAAAVAAAFNTPVAAVLFTLEEVVGDLHAPVLGSVVLASATSWVTLHLILGDEPLFHVPAYQIVHPLELTIYALLGVLGGLASVLFTRLLATLRKRFLRTNTLASIHPAVGGAVVGLVALAVPQVLGVGYAHVGQVLNGRMVLRLMLLLVLLKIVTVTISYASGNAGGIFGPSLFIGAMLGGGLGMVAHTLFPEYTASSGAYALVGMGTAFAGIIRAPMTSVIMIFETTRDYAVIVPLMISNLLSFFIARRWQREPIYEVLALQDGIHLPESREHLRSRERSVGRVMHPPGEALLARMTVAEALGAVAESKLSSWLVLDGTLLEGVVQRSSLEQAIRNGLSQAELRQVSIRGVFVHKDQPIHAALEQFGQSKIDLLPVVHRENIRSVEGIVTLDDILTAYGIGPPSNPR
jgi:CIC family chloride channel protein